MQIRPTAFTIGLIIYSFIALFAVYTEFGIDSFKKQDVIIKASEFVRDTMLPAMDKLRAAADKAETITAEDYYPFPTYDKLLFGV